MKRKGHLAVFENILEENTSNQEDDYINEDEYEVKPKIQKRFHRLSDEPITFLCRFKECFEEFNEYYDFDKHLTAHIKKEDFEGKSTHTFCRYGDCDLRYISYLHAIQHMSIHAYHDRLCNLGELAARRNSLPDCNLENTFTCSEVEDVYKCEWDDCNLQLDTICNFLAHVKMHVNANPRKDFKNKIKCEWKGCGNKYNLLYQLSKHMPVHTKDKYIACFTCGNTFASLVRFSDHRSKQIPIEKQYYKCSQCLKLFATESLLRDHVRAHINQYKCPMCDMTCPKPSNVINHIRFRHLDFRFFKCNLCEHSAISKQNLEQHLITHCAEKLLACDECDFRCRSIHTLDRHIQREHVQHWQIYECHICKEQFGRSWPLTKHLMASHSVQRPSGHSRFRYKRDPDGIARLQTIRYETVNVIKEIIENKSKDKTVPERKKLRCSFKRNIDCDNGDALIKVEVEEITKSEKDIKKRNKSSNDILMTISDIDKDGNVLAEVTETQKLLIPKQEIGEDMMEL
ncbi:histone H4 transcription factor-like [Coccinella septempunctata]|uniref:histone H4 transcription factor-like n=1 Tax=Coccinella septempunctata TaxID=41139 RepID=UPI001D07DC97|nr:histone H4 transcription factor-like [Coccinella septempunctata]XP_044753061.1 histone H4 transcription factor-like [Coccinella septempunctata]